MRIVFINLHANEFLVKTAGKYLFKQSVALKHQYFLMWLLKQPDIEVINFINEKGFSLQSGVKSLKWLAALESKIILKKSGIYGRVKVIRNSSELREDDIIIGYRHVPSSLYKMNELPGFKVISLIHFHGEQSDSRIISASNPDVLINESNLSKFSTIYQKYYDPKIPIIVHPFVGADRFQNLKAFTERENRCFSIGTITYKQHPEFLEVYGDSCDQPCRKQILDNQESLKTLVACFNANYLENGHQKAISVKDNPFARKWKAWYNLRHVGHQKTYFSFNMVEKMNEFQMCLVGEEILGIPGIGFVEGMCCGCAYIGQTVGYYEDYGMKEGVHYIGYDGTIDDLKNKINYYQQPEHQDELKQIAENGYRFAQEHFRGDKVAEELLRKLVEARENRTKEKLAK